jgi:hypothetical protein
VNEVGLLATDRTTVSASYHLFGLHDPTCEEILNFGTAIPAAGVDSVGWATNALSVNVVSDLARILVEVAVYSGPPPVDDSADLVREGELALPGGQISIPQSLDDRFLRGFDVASGPGTYRIRVCGYGRTDARQIWDHGVEVGGSDAVPAIREALQGVEHYRIELWLISPEPRWPDDDDDDDDDE